jgi:hypothetical protein
MSTPEPSTEAGPAKFMPRIPLRFSLRTLMVGTTFFAIWCAFVAILPMAFSQLVVGAFWFAATGWLVTGVIFGRRDQRAFCLGAALVASSMWTGLGGQYMQGIHSIFGFEQSLGVWLDLLVIAATAVANGWCCIWARRFFDRSVNG